MSMRKLNGGILLAMTVAGLLAMTVGCSSGKPAPTSTAPATTALAFDKREVDLGTVPQDQEGAETFLVMNMGATPLTVGPAWLEVLEGCDQASINTGTLEVLPKQADILSLHLNQHRDLGPHRVLIHLPSSDPQTPLTTLTVSFVVAGVDTPPATGPRLRVDKEIVDSGSVPSDWPLYEQFTLRNAGDEPLVMEGLDVVRVEEGC